MILYTIKIEVHHIFIFKGMFILHMEFELCLLKNEFIGKRSVEILSTKSISTYNNVLVVAEIY